MSDLAAAAAAMGIPEAMVQRSAEARAQATGSTVEEILAAWAGGGAAPATAAVTAEAPAPARPAAEAAPPAAAPEVEAPAVIEMPEVGPKAAPVAAPIRGGKPPILVGAADNPLSILVAAIGLFVMIFFVALVGPSLQTDTPGARSSEIAFSSTALDGRDLYTSLGCGACHTQLIRPVVADVGLGAVTLNDSNQPLGTRRFGPDLSDIGSRMNPGELENVIGGAGDHQGWSLSEDDLSALVAYLSESRTSGGGA